MVHAYFLQRLYGRDDAVPAMQIEQETNALLPDAC